MRALLATPSYATALHQHVLQNETSIKHLGVTFKQTDVEWNKHVNNITASDPTNFLNPSDPRTRQYPHSYSYMFII